MINNEQYFAAVIIPDYLRHSDKNRNMLNVI